jgi:GDPmannose 4,6-dehydratase
MHLMLQQDAPEDFVVGTGESHSVRDFCEAAFREVNLDYRDYVAVDEKFWRPAEVDTLLADPSKAQSILGWKPEHSFQDLVSDMVCNDLELVASSRARLRAIANQPGPDCIVTCNCAVNLLEKVAPHFLLQS